MGSLREPHEGVSEKVKVLVKELLGISEEVQVVMREVLGVRKFTCHLVCLGYTEWVLWFAQ